MNHLLIPCDTGGISDGYHTFDELYEHRCLLFMMLMQNIDSDCWRSKLHDDGQMYEGWFVAGIKLETGMITYHLPDSMWPLLDGGFVTTLDHAPAWDGHTPKDVIFRMKGQLEKTVEEWRSV